MPVYLKIKSHHLILMSSRGKKSVLEDLVTKEIPDLSSEISYAVVALWHFVLPTGMTELLRSMKTISLYGPQFNNNLSGLRIFEAEN